MLTSYAAQDVKEGVFWDKMSELLDHYKSEDDLLLQMMKMQEKNNDLHTIDYGWIERMKV